MQQSIGKPAIARGSEADRLKSKLREREALETEIRELQTRERERLREQERRTHEVAGRVALAFFKRNPDQQISREIVQLVTEEIKRLAERDVFEALSIVHRSLAADAASLLDDSAPSLNGNPMPANSVAATSATAGSGTTANTGSSVPANGETSLAEKWSKAHQQSA